MLKVGAPEGAITGKLAASALAAMNPHYHSYGGPELTSPHPPSPDNNNYHAHPGPGGPQLRMHQSNGHGIGPLGNGLCVVFFFFVRTYLVGTCSEFFFTVKFNILL